LQQHQINLKNQHIRKKRIITCHDWKLKHRINESRLYLEVLMSRSQERTYKYTYHIKHWTGAAPQAERKTDEGCTRERGINKWYLECVMSFNYLSTFMNLSKALYIESLVCIINILPMGRVWRLWKSLKLLRQRDM
jgi:hypothetical protein